jgi:hypothetical protein
MAPKDTPNLLIIPETDQGSIQSALSENGITAGHFTNGAYTAVQDLVVPTVLAGFQYAVDKGIPFNESAQRPALIIAVNSNKSMLAAYDRMVNKTEEEKAALKAALGNEQDRALKVAEPLAQQHPNRQVVVMFYDEQTPNELYSSLKEGKFEMKSLFKWGVGTDPKGPVVEGAKYFDVVRAHPFPNSTEDIPLAFHDLTRRGGQEGNVRVVDLREPVSPQKMYQPLRRLISPENKCTFRLASGLKKFELPPFRFYGIGQRPSPPSREKRQP